MSRQWAIASFPAKSSSTFSAREIVIGDAKCVPFHASEEYNERGIPCNLQASHARPLYDSLRFTRR